MSNENTAAVQPKAKVELDPRFTAKLSPPTASTNLRRVFSSFCCLAESLKRFFRSIACKMASIPSVLSFW